MIATGWNGTPAGFPSNLCETGSKTKDEVVHAERNAIDKMTLEGVSTRGSILFTTTAPCIECAKSIAAVGIIKVYFKNTYRSDDGTVFLKRMGVETERYYD
jgi:dCMP deaminase